MKQFNFGNRFFCGKCKRSCENLLYLTKFFLSDAEVKLVFLSLSETTFLNSLESFHLNFYKNYQRANIQVA